jgi:type II restriction enzyme
MPPKQFSLRLSNKQAVLLPDNKHNRVQKAVIEHFVPHFAQDASLVYFRHSSKRKNFCDMKLFADIEPQLADQKKWPDVILLDKKKKWLYLIHTITSHKPSIQQRVIESKKIFSECSFGLIFITAFSGYDDMNKYMTEIVWETEAWIAEVPDHLTHFNGDRFWGPH